MTGSTFLQKIKRLESFFGNTMSKDQAKLWHEKLSAYEDEDLAEGIEWCIENKQRMPSLSEMLAAVDSMQHNRMRAEAERANREERQAAAAFFVGTLATDSYAKKAMKNIGDMLSGTKTRKQFLYDSEGLGMNMGETRKLYVDLGVDLNKPAGPTRRRVIGEEIGETEAYHA